MNTGQRDCTAGLPSFDAEHRAPFERRSIRSGKNDAGDEWEYQEGKIIVLT